ncbi:hypothetical protein QA860_08185 [Streptomyces stelliscabiei]|uniref:hypothetical protein n=1 Tax=Streptomyces stelliscabiei TaxID=146820 RepID=UPI0029A7D5BB|nr:hypothetical protein [Streptomyces stelliscabiei]MDX2550149.1 hypothetical protein [Streptomyces stelliscabiei]
MGHATDQAPQPPSPRTEPWPDGVIARYLTVAGATVDVSHDMHYLADTEPNLTLARCGGEGCEATHTEKWGPYAYRNNNGSKGADQEVAKWAQVHASECRALPRPAVTL